MSAFKEFFKGLGKGIVGIGFILILILLAIGAYHLERNLNWKMGYSGKVEKMVEEKVEQRFEALEKRIDILETQAIMEP
jgi:hypothetical protein